MNSSVNTASGCKFSTWYHHALCWDRTLRCTPIGSRSNSTDLRGFDSQLREQQILSRFLVVLQARCSKSVPDASERAHKEIGSGTWVANLSTRT